MLSVARAGAVSFLLAGLLTVALAGLATAGQPVGLGGANVNGELVMLDVILLGLGAFALAWRPGPRLAARFTRASFAIFALGPLGLVLAMFASWRLAPGYDSMADGPTVIFGVAGLILFPIGATLVVLALLRAAAAGRSS
ncbi:MAG: hypothetical protein ACHQ15_08115 [Candidatus Limnocylindrales bacterium]